METNSEQALPAGLAERPVDPRRKLPIPAVNEREDGTADFLVINGRRALELASRRQCGVCAKPMGERVAFIGGPNSAASGAFSDPPMHVDCAEAALRLCPHIARQHARRAGEGRTDPGATVPDGFMGDKPSEWVLVETQGYAMVLAPAAGGGRVPVFLATTYEAVRRFGYVEGVLVEQEGQATARP
ncbi:hypothetical protein LN042_18810 [Kitasatospora sp. RB6PN24]|uniref:hypothetical protein n=1 Tax=Kitasatospora humi TaxID=2893891 RepID=UPI001E4ABCA4|nr:hypothetical protein [Kitasatospora humi]MCC9309107.1 hypothetical protein [Kitasatospora humi]